MNQEPLKIRIVLKRRRGLSLYLAAVRACWCSYRIMRRAGCTFRDSLVLSSRLAQLAIAGSHVMEQLDG